MTAPEITIFVRHAAGCKYAGDEFARRCDCRKHFRWSANGKQHRKAAETRSWAEAERLKRELEDELSGRAVPAKAQNIRECVALFLQDKRVQGVAPDTVATFARELERLVTFCEGYGVHHIHGVTRDVLTRYCATWLELYPSSVTRSKVRERCKTFLRYCYEAQWLPRVPVLPKIRVEYPPTLPLTSEEFARLLASIPKGLPDAQSAKARVRVRALFLLMRWSGLAIRDALCLRRDAITNSRGFYRVVAKRAKTGTEVSVPIPPDVAVEILAVPNAVPEYLFWSGESDAGNLGTKWASRFVAPVFKAAGLYDDEMHAVSHRLRDTFAVDLLEKGVPMEEVSKLLGHTSIRTTEKHYAKWSKGRQDRVDDLVSATWQSASVGPSLVRRRVA